MGSIDGRHSRSNSTTKRPGTITQNEPHRVRLRVELNNEKASINASLDDELVATWHGKSSLLTPDFGKDSPTPGEFMWFANTATLVHSAKLRALPQARVGTDGNPTTPDEGSNAGTNVPVAPKGTDGLPQLVALRHFVSEGSTPVGFLQGGRFALRCRQSIAYIVDLATGKDVTEMRSSGAYVRAAAITPNEQQVVVGYRRGGDPTVFSTANGQALRQLVGHEQADTMIWYLDISPNGKTVVTAGGDDTIRLWEVATGKKLASAEHADANRVALSPDGKHALSASSRDGGAILWQLP